MKADILLDFAVFQLTPTRTRCELLISCKGVSEKLASGLLKPFLAHLRAAEEQIAVGGYSIRLEPPLDGNASWFTKGTMLRFVRFVSTPEVLERVSAVETELIQLEEELSNYNHEVDDRQSVSGSVVINSGGRSFSKFIKQARKDSLDDEADGNETSKSRLIKAMETRHAVLQREQGMAFARAIAAGFDVDHVSDLIAFAECFGAARLSEACHKFAALCKKQQEGDLWLDEMELVAAEGAYNYSETNGGITIAPAGMTPLTTTTGLTNKEFEESITKETDAATRNDNHRRQSSGYLSDQQGFPHIMGMQPPPYAPWMHFGNEQGYFPQGVMQMPQNPYMNGSFGQMSPYWGVPPPGAFNNKSDAGQADQEPTEENGSKKTGRKSASPRRRSGSPLKKLQVGRSGKRSGMVLIRNINYITSQESSGANKNRSTENESDESASEFETSSEVEHPQGQVIEDRNSQSNGKKKKEPRRKQCAAAEVSLSSEGSQGSTTGRMKKDADEEMFFTVPARSNREDEYKFDSESLAQQQARIPSELAIDDAFLNGGRANGSNRGTQYGLENQMSSNNLASKDGMLLPHRNQAGDHGSKVQDSELSAAYRSHRLGSGHDVDDSFIIPERAGPGGQGLMINETTYQVQKQGSQQDNSNDGHLADLFIVPSRPVRDTSESTRRTLELEMPGDQVFAGPKDKSDTPKFEPDDIWMLPERSKESLEKRWNDVDYDMEVMGAMQKAPDSVPEVEEDEEFYEQYHEQRDAKLMKESGSKKAEREARMKSLQDTLDKRKAEMSSRFKSTRSSILKTKKEKEEAERKRIEDIAAERRNRIAARTGGSSTASRTSSVTTSSASIPRPATKPALSSTPTNKDPSQLMKKTLASRNPLSRSVPSLPELRKENTKPATVRPQASKTQESSSVPAKKSLGIPGKKPTTSSTRKSIATLQDLKTQKASNVGDNNSMPGKTDLKSMSDPKLVAKVDAMSLKTESTVQDVSSAARKY